MDGAQPYAQEDGIMIAFEVSKALRVDEGVEVKFNSELREHFDFAQALDQRQLVFSDAIGIQAPGQGPRVIEDGPDAAPAQFGSAGKRGRAGADERYGSACICCRRKGKRGAARVERVHGEALQPCDLNGLFVVAVHHAGAFAQDLDRASAGAAGAKDVGVQDGAGGSGQVAAGDLLDKTGNIDMRGASRGAGRIEAVEAPIGFGDRGLPVQRRMEITEARRGFRMHRRLLHKRSLAAHSGDTLSLRR